MRVINLINKIYVQFIFRAPVCTVRHLLYCIGNSNNNYTSGVYGNFDGAESVTETKKYTEILTIIIIIGEFTLTAGIDSIMGL